MYPNISRITRLKKGKKPLTGLQSDVGVACHSARNGKKRLLIKINTEIARLSGLLHTKYVTIKYGFDENFIDKKVLILEPTDKPDWNVRTNKRANQGGIEINPSVPSSWKVMRNTKARFKVFENGKGIYIDVPPLPFAIQLLENKSKLN